VGGGGAVDTGSGVLVNGELAPLCTSATGRFTIT
jgi:hypothetical protein